MLEGLRAHQEQFTQAHLVNIPRPPPDSIEEIFRHDQPSPVPGEVVWTWLQSEILLHPLSWRSEPWAGTTPPPA